MDPGSGLLEDVSILSTIERVGSALSLAGSIFVIATFCASKEFHKPINRLVFYASFGNMMTTVGTLMATSFIDNPTSPGCQLQAFLIQMFMPADAFWTLAMAINVYLTFYFKFDAERLRRMELPYFFFCYGVPFVPAFTYIFIKNSAGQRMYGNATLWCWVTPEWDVMRIATFYGPIWVIMVITFIIYIRAGRTIYEKRNQLRNVDNTDSELATVTVTDNFGTVKTTEVMVTSEAMNEPTAILGISSPLNMAAPNGAYSVTISSSNKRGEASRPQTSAASVATSAFTRPHSAHPGRRRMYELNNAAWSYTKCAILFFTAILITWIPSSANRVYSVVHGGGRSLTLEYMSALVLPLQGFWNAVIYCVTSWSAVKMLSADIRSGIFGWSKPSGSEEIGDAYAPPFRHQSGRSTTRYKSDSVTEFANSRSSSNERSPPSLDR